MLGSYYFCCMVDQGILISMNGKERKQLQRDAFDRVFDEIGGIEHLKAYALENPKDFYKLWVKLAPNIKEDKGLQQQTHEAFIRMCQAEEQKMLGAIDKPIKLIDVDIHTIDIEEKQLNVT